MNCPKCGRLFTKIVSPVCPKCERADEEQFQKLRDYLEEYPLSSITEASDATGVSPKRILEYLREGRLQITKGLEGELRCARCGTAIETGNFCDTCNRKFAKELSYDSPSLGPGPSASSSKRSSGMHIYKTKKDYER